MRNPLLELEHQIPFGGLTGVCWGAKVGRTGGEGEGDGRIEVGGEAKKAGR